MKKEIILIDKNDKEIGVGEKIETHKKGLLHRSFSILVFNTYKNELLIQKRVDSKYHSGGLWSNTCCGHPKPGESLNDAAHRRLKEEMGFDCELKELLGFKYKIKFTNGLSENEYNHVFIGKFDNHPAINRKEVQDWKWISFDKLRKDMVQNPENYTYWFRLILNKYGDIFDIKQKDIFVYMKNIAKEVDDYIIEKLSNLKKKDLKLYEITSHLVILRRNQPKLRSSLACLLYESLGGKDWKRLVPMLAFMELSTVASYVLDDIIDEQPERNGDEATFKKFGLNYGMAAGSLQTFISIEMLSDLKIKESVKLKLFELANYMWRVLWEGEGHNEHMKEGTTVDRYIERCYELAGVMFETATKMAAIIYDANNKIIKLSGEIGKLFGIATMIRNDLTVFMPEELMKERSGALSRKSFEDVKKGLYTYPIICVTEKIKNKDNIKIKNLLGNKNTNEKELLGLTRLLIEMGCIDKTLDLINFYKLESLKLIERLKNSKNKQKLIRFLNLLDNTRIYVKDFKSKIY